MTTRACAARAIRLIVDFDGTITKKDTLHLVSQAGYDKQEALPIPVAPTSWKTIVDAYLNDFSQHQASYKPGKHDRKSFNEEIAWLNSLKPIETASAVRFQRAGVFNGVRRRHLIEAAERVVQKKEVQVRPGFYELLDGVYCHNKSFEISDDSDQLQVLSVNWSRQFVWSVIEAAAPANTNSAVEQQMRTVLHSMSVYANEAQSIIDDDDYGSIQPAGEAVTLRTSGDKLQQMLRNRDTNSIPLVVYVGDSVTDLECLMAADVGICIRDEPMGSGQAELAETCARLDIPVNDIASHPKSVARIGDAFSSTTSGLWWARDFIGIDQWFKNITQE